MTINRVPSGPVYIGTEFSLITEVTFNDNSRIDVALAFVAQWRNNGGFELKDTNGLRISNNRSHTSILTFTSIGNADNGRYTATIIIRALNETLRRYIYPVTASASETIMAIEGRYDHVISQRLVCQLGNKICHNTVSFSGNLCNCSLTFYS